MATGVVSEGRSTDGRVVTADTGNERIETIGRVEVAGDVGKQRASTSSRICLATDIVKER